MKRIAGVLCAALTLWGCNSTEGDATTGGGRVRPGLYEYQKNLNIDGSFVEAKHQVKLSEDKTLSASTFGGAVLLCEEKSKYELKQDSIRTFERLSRCIGDAGAFGPWESEGATTRQIRNITATSFQIWWVAPESSSGTGLTTEWRTYNRIGDG